LIEKALSLRNWTEVSIEVKSLDLDDPPRGAPGRSNVISTRVLTQFPNTELGTLPVQNTSFRVNYPEKTFSMHNNYMMSLENRLLLVEVSEGDPRRDPVRPHKLGDFVFTLNEIEKKCPSHGSSVEISKRLDSLGLMIVNAKRRSADIEYFATKRQEIVDILKTQIDTMERFNHEYSYTKAAKLTSNVRGIHGIPLLYAAIEVMADRPLIQKLLRLGADPNKQPQHSSHCTPLELVKKQYERCQAKAKDAQARGKLAAAAQAQAQKTAEAKSLLDMLEGVGG